MIGVALRRRMINLCQQWLALKQSIAEKKYGEREKDCLINLPSTVVDVIISSSIKQSHFKAITIRKSRTGLNDP